MMDLLKGFMDIYGEEYIKKIPRAYNYIMRWFGEEYKESCMAQVHAALGVYEEYNYYKEYFKLLKKYDFLSLNLLEVAYGPYPILPKYIDEYQSKERVGSITAQDPVSVVSQMGNIKFIEEPFYSYTDISMYDACIGIFPCEVTEDIIDNAIPKGKDLFLAICDHPHFGDYGDGFYGGDYDMWERHIYRLIKEDLRENKVIIREELDAKFGRPYAIFIVIEKDKADAILSRKIN